MSRKLFHEPLDDLISHSSSNNLSPNRRIIPVNKKLAITLYFLRGNRRGIFVNGSQCIWCSFIYCMETFRKSIKLSQNILFRSTYFYPEQRKKWSKNPQNLKKNLGWLNCLAVLMVAMLLFHVLLRIPRTSIVMRNFYFHCSSSLWFQEFLWVWSANGLAPSTMSKCFAIQI